MKINNDKLQGLISGRYAVEHTQKAANPLSFFFEEEDCSEVTLDNTNDEDPVYIATQPFVQTYSNDSVASMDEKKPNPFLTM